MCTLVILTRPGHAWPLLVAGNRDEMRNRASVPPGRHWKTHPQVIAGLDRVGGGSWMGMNDYGVTAAVMNREGTLGPQPGKRTRGELVLKALEHAEASAAVGALKNIDTTDYRAFNLFIGDPVSAYWLHHRGESAGSRVESLLVEPGLHMLTAGDLDDLAQPRIHAYLPLFRKAEPPDPEAGHCGEWRALLASRAYPEELGSAAAMNLSTRPEFGTVSSSCIAVPAHPGPGATPRWWFSDGPPDCAVFNSVDL